MENAKLIINKPEYRLLQFFTWNFNVENAVQMMKNYRLQKRFNKRQILH